MAPNWVQCKHPNKQIGAEEYKRKRIDECLTMESQLINAERVTDSHANKQMKTQKEMHQIGVFLSDRFNCEFS